MKKVLSVLISAVILFSSVQAFAASSPSSWAASEVKAAISEGIVPEGLTANYQSAITRKEFCEMVVLLYDKLGGADVSVGAAPFTDTDNESVAKAYQLKIVLGVGEGLFAPDNLITRQEICTMFARAVQAAMPEVVIPSNLPNTFPDIDTISDWALDNVKYANILEVMLGDEANRIKPFNNTTREQAILLSHRMLGAFAQDISSFLAIMGFNMSGNNSVNMMNGAFAITYTGGPMYLSDKTGIYAVSESGARNYVTTDEALTIFMQGSEKYYIKKSDGLIYGANNTPICDMRARNITPAGDYIYFTSPDAAGIFRIPVRGGAPQLFDEGNIQMAVSSGKYIYFNTPDGIYKHDINENTVQKIYDGTVSSFAVSNSRLYFKDSEGFLVVASSDGTGAKRITKVPVDSYCTYGTEAVVYTTSDGVYKTNLNANFAIRICERTFGQVNTYNNNIFLKDSDDSIYRLSSNGMDFTKLN